ncbi:MAG: cytochrome ubiquinol oxidase subunit I [Thermodesulfobacteriota bacterium]|nr:cytochrome ubiquinol oxidase subunit I [Thermodesulfobacteriota bacterium]
MKKAIGYFIVVVLVAAAYFLGKEPVVEAYREFPLIGARNVVWILAQLMLLFAAFILAVPVFAVIIEAIGYFKRDERYDRLARDFASLLPLAYLVTALLGALFSVMSFSLYPKFMGYMAGIFRPTIYIFFGLVFLETVTLYIWYYTWDLLKKRNHLLLGIVLNVLGTLVMFVGNAWTSFKTSPAGVEVSGNLLSLSSAIFNYTFWPLNLHRFVANVSFGGFICAAYAAYRFLSARTPEEKAHYDWMGYNGTLIGVVTTILLPFIGYWFGIEMYKFNEQMGITFMGGALSKIWLLQALVIAVIFIGTCYYFWLRMDRLPGAERYRKYIPYLSWALIIAFAVWSAPRAWVSSLEEMGRGLHPIYGKLGIMAPKIAAVNIAVLCVILTFILNRRAERQVPPGRKIYTYLQWSVILLVVLLNVAALYYSYIVPSATRIRISIATFLFMVPAIGMIYLMDGLLLRGSERVGEMQWGNVPPRSQYGLIAVAVSNVWAMALLGYGRAAARLNWHVYGVMEDTSRHAGLPAMGEATLIISFLTLVFIGLVSLIFYMTGVTGREVTGGER